VPRPRNAPVAAQDVEQLRREHDIALASSLALLDPDHHAAVVDVGDLQVRRFGGAQPSRIRGRQRGAALEARPDFKEANDLVRAQHDRKLLQLARIRNPLGKFRPPRRDAIKEPQGADCLIERRP
jgi:hypothetical protein